MNNMIIRIYDNFSHAEHARDALLASGFDAPDVQLTVNDDEAGAVEGNFAVGNGNYKDESYKNNYASAVKRSAFMLTVDVVDEAQQHRATDIMDKFGAVDVDSLTAKSR